MSKHTETAKVIARLARIEGHVGAVKRMVQDGRNCTDVLVQFAAVRSALDKAAKILLADHMEHCVFDSLTGRNPKKHLSDLREAIESFIS